MGTDLWREADDLATHGEKHFLLFGRSEKWRRSRHFVG